MNKENKTPKFTFSEIIDNAINGYAVGVSFFVIGLFLLLNPHYFFKPFVSYIVGTVMGAFGVIGTGIELSQTSKIKGMDNLSMGLVAFTIWFVAYIKIAALWANISLFLFLVFGVYFICVGMMEASYSIVNNLKSKRNEDSTEEKISIGSMIRQIMLLATQICSLVVAVLNLLKATKM